MRQARGQMFVNRHSDSVLSNSNSVLALEYLDPEDFPFQLDMLGQDIQNLLKSLKEFPEFSDENVEQCICSFEADLRVSHIYHHSKFHS